MSAYRSNKKPGTMMPATPLMKGSNQFYDNTPLESGIAAVDSSTDGFVGAATSETVAESVVASIAMGDSGRMAEGQTKPTNMG